MLYVGVSHYFATGEGFTIYVASGSKESIRKSIPEDQLFFREVYEKDTNPDRQKQ